MRLRAVPTDVARQEGVAEVLGVAYEIDQIQQTEIDRQADELRTEDCGQAFIRYNNSVD